MYKEDRNWSDQCLMKLFQAWKLPEVRYFRQLRPFIVYRNRQYVGLLLTVRTTSNTRRRIKSVWNRSYYIVQRNLPITWMLLFTKQMTSSKAALWTIQKMTKLRFWPLRKRPVNASKSVNLIIWMVSLIRGKPRALIWERHRQGFSQTELAKERMKFCFCKTSTTVYHYSPSLDYFHPLTTGWEWWNKGNIWIVNICKIHCRNEIRICPSGQELSLYCRFIRCPICKCFLSKMASRKHSLLVHKKEAAIFYNMRLRNANISLLVEYLQRFLY